jgi:hypothetical protein
MTLAAWSLARRAIGEGAGEKGGRP